MKNEKLSGGEERDLIMTSEAIVRDYEQFLISMITYVNSIDRKYVKDHKRLELSLLLLANLGVCCFENIKDVVRELRSLCSCEVNFSDLDDLYEFANHIFIDYLKNNGYNVEAFYETKKDAEKA